MDDIAPGRNIPSKPKLTRQQLDGRTSAAKHFDLIVSRVTKELGSNLSILQEGLVEAYAGARINLDVININMLLGQNIEPSEYAAAVSTMMHLSQCLGLKQQQKEAAA